MLTRRKKAFTLIEVLMVIVILGMLAGVAVMTFRGTREGAKEDTTRLLLKQISNALARYENDLQSFPTEDQGSLEALTKKPDFEDEKKGKKWRGPYVDKGLEDAWGNEIQYEVNEDVGDEAGALPYKLFSMGPDGQPDTDDDINLIEDDEEDI